MPSVALAYQKKRHAEGLADTINSGPFDYGVDVISSDGINLYRTLRTNDYEIVQTDEALRKGAVAALASRDSKMHLCLDIQGWADYLNSHGKHGLLTSTGVSIVANSVFRQSDGIIFVSKATKEKLEGNFEFTEWRYAMPVFDISRYSGPHINNGGRFASEILTVTNLRYESKLEGIRTILQAIEPLLKEYDCRYRIAGNGRYFSQLKDYVKNYQHTDRVDLLGYRGDIPNLLQSADLFVYASQLDSLGMVVLEAQAAGLPVIAGDVGGIPEAMGDTGVVCPSNPESLRPAIRTLIIDPTLRHILGEQARTRMGMYAERQAARHMELWKSIVP